VTAEAVLDALRRKGATVATAESCTGGLVAAAITAVPGSSEAFLAGYVTYANSAKISMLGVDPETLDEHGAVSEDVARQMAAGAADRSGATLAVSTTGVAGPGASGRKPEGRVCFGLATPDGVKAETVEFGPLGRAQVREASVAYALALLLAAAQRLP
jgi:nicotinamide-nucleotide amidase